MTGACGRTAAESSCAEVLRAVENRQVHRLTCETIASSPRSSFVVTPARAGSRGRAIGRTILSFLHGQSPTGVEDTRSGAYCRTSTREPWPRGEISARRRRLHWPGTPCSPSPQGRSWPDGGQRYRSRRALIERYSLTSAAVRFAGWASSVRMPSASRLARTCRRQSRTSAAAPAR